jgi:hypothetical protein
MSKPLLMEWDDDAEDYEEVFDSKREAEFWEEELQRCEAEIQAQRKAKQPSADDASSSEPVTHPLYQYAWDAIMVPKTPPSSLTSPTESSSPEVPLPVAAEPISFPRILLDL